MRILLILSVCSALEISLFVQGRQLDYETSEIEELKNRIKALENRNGRQDQDNKRFVLYGELEYPVGFTACVAVSDLTSLGSHQTIVFDRTITNTGGAYHNHTGIFIAPVKGLYVFHLAAMSSPGDNQYLQFMKDNVVISHVYPDSRGTSTFQTGSGDWVMELNQNSEVWIQTKNAGEIHGNCFSIFSGFLLQQME